MINKSIYSLISVLFYITKSWSILHNLIRNIYLKITIPILSILLKKKFSNILLIIPRNSILEKDRFNAFLSDIDLSFVIKDGSDTKSILTFFRLIQNYLFILDDPEVYYLSEYEELLQIQNNPQWNIVNTFWHIRKINWNFIKLKKTNNKFEKFKRKRSIDNSFIQISNLNHFVNQLSLRDLKCFDSFSFPSDGNTNFFISLYLETNSKSGLRLLLNSAEYELLSYLMPETAKDQNHAGLKKIISKHEILITLASIRLDESEGVNCDEKKIWVKKISSLIS